MEYIITQLVFETLKEAELKFHISEKEIGKRYVPQLKGKIPIYIALRKFEIEFINDKKDNYVETHEHNVDSLWIFIGNESDLKGLTVEVCLGDTAPTQIESPVVVWIPKGVKHSYSPLRGSGIFINIVLASDYNACTTRTFIKSKNHE